MAKYRVKRGMEYLGKRAEIGDLVSDLPPKAIKWLRECDAIEIAEGDAIEDEVVEAEIVEAGIVEAGETE